MVNRYAEAKTTLCACLLVLCSDMEGRTLDLDSKGQDNIQKSKTKCKCQSYLLRLPKLQLPHLWNGENQSRKISHNGRGSICNPRSNLIDAVTRQVRIPQLLHRDADEDEKKRDANDPCDHEGTNPIGKSLEVRKAEDSVIHHQ